MGNTMRGDLGKAFESLKGWMFKNYNGVLIERVKEGFKVGDKVFDTIDLVKIYIDKRRKEFQELIKKQNPAK